MNQGKLVRQFDIQENDPTEPSLGFARFDKQGTRAWIGKLVVRRDRGKLLTWDLIENRRLKEFSGVKEIVNESIDITPDGSRAISFAGRKPIVYQWPSGKIVYKLHHDRCSAAAISEDSSLALTGDNDGILKIWSLETGNCIKNLNHGEWIQGIELTHDNRFAVVRSEKRLGIWSMDEGVELMSTDVPSSTDSGTVALSPDGSRLIFSVGSKIEVWDLDWEYTFDDLDDAEISDSKNPARKRVLDLVSVQIDPTYSEMASRIKMPKPPRSPERPLTKRDEDLQPRQWKTISDIPFFFDKSLRWKLEMQKKRDLFSPTSKARLRTKIKKNEVLVELDWGPETSDWIPREDGESGDRIYKSFGGHWISELGIISIGPTMSGAYSRSYNFSCNQRRRSFKITIEAFKERAIEELMKSMTCHIEASAGVGKESADVSERQEQTDDSKEHMVSFHKQSDKILNLIQDYYSWSEEDKFVQAKDVLEGVAAFVRDVPRSLDRTLEELADQILNTDFKDEKDVYNGIISMLYCIVLVLHPRWDLRRANDFHRSVLPPEKRGLIPEIPVFVYAIRELLESSLDSN